MSNPSSGLARLAARLNEQIRMKNKVHYPLKPLQKFEPISIQYAHNKPRTHNQLSYFNYKYKCTQLMVIRRYLLLVNNVLYDVPGFSFANNLVQKSFSRTIEKSRVFYVGN